MSYSVTNVGGGNSVSPTSSNNHSVAAQIYDFYTSNGLSPSAASAMLGNFAQESSLNPSDQGGYLAQWGGGRLTALQAYANSQNQPVTNLNTQLQFSMQELPSELKQYGGLTVAQLNKMSPSQAALAISKYYERPAFWAANNSNRENYANAYYQEFVNGKTPPSNLPQGSTTTGSTNGSTSTINTNGFSGLAKMWASISQFENPKGFLGGLNPINDVTTYEHRLPFIALGLVIITIGIISVLVKNKSATNIVIQGLQNSGSKSAIPSSSSTVGSAIGSTVNGAEAGVADAAELAAV